MHVFVSVCVCVCEGNLISLLVVPVGQTQEAFLFRWLISALTYLLVSSSSLLLLVLLQQFLLLHFEKACPQRIAKIWKSRSMLYTTLFTNDNNRPPLMRFYSQPISTSANPHYSMNTFHTTICLSLVRISSVCLCVCVCLCLCWFPHPFVQFAFFPLLWIKHWNTWRALKTLTQTRWQSGKRSCVPE